MSYTAQGWFPSGRNINLGWHFDIVGLLAVIGESSVEDHVQIITASNLSYIPRLIPAPQTFLKTERPKRLPHVPNVKVVGVLSGTTVEELNYFANAIHEVEELEDFEFREYRIDYTPGAAADQKRHVEEDNQESNQNDAGIVKSPIASVRQQVAARKRQFITSQRKTGNPQKAKERKIHIRMHQLGVLNGVTILTVLMTAGLIAWAAAIHDGVACVAIFAISVSTSLACLSSQWYPRIAERPSTALVPGGDVVIKTRGGAFVVVHCVEEITRELYTAKDTCDYVVTNEEFWALLKGTSTILLMVAVVLLGNCGWVMQAATGVAYIILNAIYWALPFLLRKQKLLWLLNERYDIHDTTDEPWEGEDNEEKEKEKKPNKALVNDEFDNRPSFTRTLAYAIRATKDIEWVQKGGFAPNTSAWGEWLEEAKANLDNKDWDPVAAKDRIMKKEVERKEKEQADAALVAVHGTV